MNPRMLCSAGLVCALISPIALTAIGQDDEGAFTAPLPGHQPDMEAMQAAMTPGPQHAFLQRFVGEWDVVMKVYFNGPDGPAAESTGTSTFESVLDGRFVQERSSIDFAMPGSPPMKLDGMGLRGYDNHRNLYTGTWADNLNSHILFFSGTPSEDGRTLTMYGEMDEPGLAMTGRHVQYITTLTDEDHISLTINDLAVSPEYTVIEMSYTRRKD